MINLVKKPLEAISIICSYEKKYCIQFVVMKNNIVFGSHYFGMTVNGRCTSDVAC